MKRLSALTVFAVLLALAGCRQNPPEPLPAAVPLSSFVSRQSSKPIAAKPLPAAQSSTVVLDANGYNSNAPIMANPNLTTGDALDVTSADICVRGYTRKVRNVPQSVKERVYRQYGITSRQKGEYEVDSSDAPSTLRGRHIISGSFEYSIFRRVISATVATLSILPSSENTYKAPMRYKQSQKVHTFHPQGAAGTIAGRCTRRLLNEYSMMSTRFPILGEMPSRLISVAMLILTLTIALPVFFVLARVWDNLRASQALGLRWFVSPSGAAMPLATAIQRANWILTALLVLIVVTLLRLAWLLFRGRRRA